MDKLDELKASLGLEVPQYAPKGPAEAPGMFSTDLPTPTPKRGRGRPPKAKAASSANNAETDERARVWIFVGYPESLPVNYADILDRMHLTWAESPVHDADVNGDGNEKKPHIHFMLVFDGKKSFAQVSEITKGLLNSTIPQICQNPRGYFRYFIHLDNPDKTQYDPAEIRCHGGFDMSNYLDYSLTDIKVESRHIMEYIRSHDIYDLADLLEYAMDAQLYEWLYIIQFKSTTYFRAYIDSRWKRRETERLRKERAGKNEDDA